MLCYICCVCVIKGFDGGILISCLSFIIFFVGKFEYGDDDEDVVEVEEFYKKKG